MAFTRVVGPGIHTQANVHSHNIQSTGIITATKFDGPFDSLTVSGNLSIGGTITYEDVTNVDSIGVITARSGVDVDDFVSVGNNIHLGNAGVITATSFSGSGANLTGIDATALKDSAGNVKIQAQASGAVHTGIHTFSTVNTTTVTGDGSGVSNINASNIASGTIAAARVPTLNQNTTGSAGSVNIATTRLNFVTFFKFYSCINYICKIVVYISMACLVISDNFHNVF